MVLSRLAFPKEALRAAPALRAWPLYRYHFDGLFLR